MMIFTSGSDLVGVVDDPTVASGDSGWIIRRGFLGSRVGLCSGGQVGAVRANAGRKTTSSSRVQDQSVGILTFRLCRPWPGWPGWSATPGWPKRWAGRSTGSPPQWPGSTSTWRPLVPDNRPHTRSATTVKIPTSHAATYTAIDTAGTWSAEKCLANDGLRTRLLSRRTCAGSGFGAVVVVVVCT